MRFYEALAERESTLVQRWLDLVLREFSGDSARFLKARSDQFANPLGHNYSEGLAGMFKALCLGEEYDVSPVLEQLMKVRAVHEKTPSLALGFLFEIKGIVREEFKKDWSAGYEAEWPGFEKRVDRLALLAFDLFMASRELLYQVRLNEFQNRNAIVTDHMRCPSALLREERRNRANGNDS